MFCNKCGKTLLDGARFCPNCGAVVVNGSSAADTGTTPASGGSAGWQTYSSSGAPVGGEVQGQSYTSGARTGQKRGKGCLIIILAAVALIAIMAVVGALMMDSGGGFGGGGSDGNYSDYGGVAAQDLSLDDLRNHYTTIKGNGEDQFTIMVYMIGSDLESTGGCATADLSEMVSATLSDNVNVIVQTGGAKEWHVNGIDPDVCQRWLVQQGSLKWLEDVGRVSMVEQSTVTDFVKFCEENYPANRYGLIFWDHGGGTVWGYGSDENYKGELMLSEIDEALTDADVKFDFVGYDACLMATIENAVMLEKHADYLIASEELEPGYGWDYTTWLTSLASDVSMPTTKLGKIIVDSFIEHNSVSDTLSVTELREIPYTYSRLCVFMNSAYQELAKQNFRMLSSARADAKTYYDGLSEMVDIVDLVSKVDIEGSDEVIAAVGSAVKYRNNCSIRGSNGISMYFPYAELSYYSNTRSDVTKVGIGNDYMGFFDNFVTILAGGQMTLNNDTNALGGASEEQTSDYSQYSWYDESLADSYNEYYNENSIQYLEIVEKGEDYVLTLSAEDWDLVTDIRLEVLLDDGTGYCDLGSDQMWEFDDDGDLMVDFDYTWVSLDGQTVAYYDEFYYDGGDDNWMDYGYVPALLNDDTYIEIILKWDQDNTSGYVAGYREYTDELGVVGKGLKTLQKGDKVEFIFDYYDYNGDYDDAYVVGDPLYIGSEMPAVSYEDVGEYTTLVTYRLTDIYQSVSYTEYVEFSF